MIHQLLKFRAWDKGHNKMCYDVNLYSLNKAGVMDKAQLENQQFMKVIGFHCEVMQYTGNQTKTKNGIYEGDIMRIHLPKNDFWGNSDQERVGIVKYEPDYGGYVVEWVWSKNQHCVILNCDIAFEGEILGNIYENKDLLETYNLTE